MMDSSAASHTGRRSLKLFGWAALPVLALAGVVLVSGMGIDVLLLAAGALLLFGLERSIGDWLGEWVGPLGAAVIFAAGAIGLSWFFLADSLGRSQTDRFFAEAERRGYQPLYYEGAHTPAASADASEDAAVARGTAGAKGGGPLFTRPSPAEPQAVERANQNRPDAVAGQQKGVDRRSPSSLFGRDRAPRPLIPTEITVHASPSTVSVARRAVISATVRAASAPVAAGTVDFLVSGVGAGRVQVNTQGIATTTFEPRLAGTYEILARYSGSSEYDSSRSASVILIVTGGG